MADNIDKLLESYKEKTGQDYYDNIKNNMINYNILVKRVNRRWNLFQDIKWKETQFIAYYEVNTTKSYKETNIIRSMEDYKYIPRRSKKSSELRLDYREEPIGFKTIGEESFHKYLRPRTGDSIWIDNKEYVIKEVYDKDIIVKGIDIYENYGKEEAEALLNEVKGYENICRKNDKCGIIKIINKIYYLIKNKL